MTMQIRRRTLATRLAFAIGFVAMGGGGDFRPRADQ